TSVWARKRRLIGTFFAVFLGVAFLAGILVFTDTIKREFDRLFSDVTKGTDAYVRASTEIKGNFGNDARGRIPDSLVATVKRVDGVAEAEGHIQGFGQLIGSDGKAIGDPQQGAPTFAANWFSVNKLNTFHLVDG